MVKFSKIDRKNTEIFGHKIKEDSIIYPITKVIFILILIGIILITINNANINITKTDDVNSVEFNTTSILLIFLPLIILVIFLSKIAKRRVIKEKLSMSDFNTYKDYYRNLIKGYSPLILGYIDTFTIDENIVLATKIQLEEPSREITESDKHILENNVFNKEILKSLIEKEAIKNGLLQATNKKDNVKKHLILSIIILILISIFIMILNSLEVFSNNPSIYFILNAIRFLYFVYALIRLLYMFHRKNNSLIRTEKGEEINLRLDGLKNFMKDFTLLDEKNRSEVKLWGDYLIYSIMFGQNKKS